MDIEIDLSKVIIETERLILRAFEERDIDDFYEYARVPGVGEMAGWPHHKTIEESKVILNIFVNGKDVLAVVFKDTGKVIGSIGLHNSWANEESEYQTFKIKEIGYVLSKDYWGKGLMPEAAAALIDYCFTVLNLDMLTCGHFESNMQSRRVIEKSGFTLKKRSEYRAEQLSTTFSDLKYVLNNPRVKQ
jgi:ribosomal-protein-alanine N-acetyltransferase